MYLPISPQSERFREKGKVTSELGGRGLGHRRPGFCGSRTSSQRLLPFTSARQLRRVSLNVVRRVLWYIVLSDTRHGIQI